MKSIMRNLSRKIRSTFGLLPPGTVTLDDLRVGDFIEVRTWWSHRKVFSSYAYEGTVLEIDKARGRVKMKRKFVAYYDPDHEENSYKYELVGSIEFFYEENDDTFKILGREYDPKQQPYTKDDI